MPDGSVVGGCVDAPGIIPELGNRFAVWLTIRDVEITKEFTLDVYNTVRRVHNKLNHDAVLSEAAKTIGTDNEFLLFGVILDKVTSDSVKELQPRWINRLAGVDIWLESHVRTALIYVRWDDKG
jgi:hypothetical protein